MPLDLGTSFVLVNTARFELELWRKGERIGTWPVIVGKPQTPTPVFAATVTGIVFNPWWDIPTSIVKESVGALVRRSPALARKRGYVWGGGRYRQKPGPNNALGQMKLVMPNPYRVYLHDTPTKQLFTREVRAMSHGCIRVGDAIGFAAALAEGTRNRAEVDALVTAGKTVEIALGERLPVYIAYITAVPAADGSVTLLPDIYERDVPASAPGRPNWPCS
jgi:murein L,D-transpeptidase YcbB/YkuD